MGPLNCIYKKKNTEFSIILTISGDIAMDIMFSWENLQTNTLSTLHRQSRGHR